MVKVIAEIGINHNGDLGVAKSLIDVAAFSRCDAVKFQKRTIDACYSKEFLDSPRSSPWGNTQRAQKEGLELCREEYDEIDRYCKEKKIEWFASAWDIVAQKFLMPYDLKYNKIASAMLTNEEILEAVAWQKKHTFVSTGMSTADEIEHAIQIFESHECPYELMVCTSTYPMADKDANLRRIETLQKAIVAKELRYCKGIGYSGHEVGLQISIAAAALWASSIERHITLDRSMYGSDQAASLEPAGLMKLVRDIRIVEQAMGSGNLGVLPAEEEVRKKLRG